MGRESKLLNMVEGMIYCSSYPITVKMRTGIKDSFNNAHLLIPKLKNLGVSAITLHGRTREQRYSKNADWDYIEQCKQLADPIPFFGNGDIFSYEMFKEYESQFNGSIMFGRGALIKPWIFQEIKEKRSWDISSSERLEIIKNYANYGLEHWGSDNEGVEKTRVFLLNWLSFLYRYIPVGILDQPQHMNQRSPCYFGRNDLETLMASSSSKDWIKISEMVLGPTQESYNFIPKHKSNG